MADPEQTPPSPPIQEPPSSPFSGNPPWESWMLNGNRIGDGMTVSSEFSRVRSLPRDRTGIPQAIARDNA